MAKDSNYLWYPFLRYQEQAIKENKEASITSWLLASGRLEHYKTTEESLPEVPVEDSMDEADLIKEV